MKIKNIIIISFLLILFASNVYAACTGSSPTWTTDGNEAADVQECVDGATSGDTINVIAGDGEADWGANAVIIPVTKALKIIGPGYTNLTINLTDNNAFVLSGTSGEPFMGTIATPGTRISGFYFKSPTDAKHTAIYARGQGWRVDHCKYESIVSAHTTAATFLSANSFNTTTSVLPTGVVDNNLIINGKIDTGIGGTFERISTQWYNSWTPGTINSIYIEDNVFTPGSSEYYQLNADDNWGAGYTARYNTFTDGRLLIHSLQDGYRGPRHWEMYGNDFTASAGNVDVTILSGTGVAFVNKMTSGGGNAATFKVGNDRSVTSKPTSGICDGSSQWDGNISGGWPCRDQVGRGSDASLWSAAATLPGPVQASQPAYFWQNYIDGSETAVENANRGGSEATDIQTNRDYYVYNASFDGSSGVGCGAALPTPWSCTTGVGYWVTAQSCANTTNMVGVTPATPISGTLWKCTATNTWTAYYTPYTYPHPLRGEGGATYFDLTITKPTGGTITSADGYINCGTSGNLCTYPYDSTASSVLTFTPDAGHYLFSTGGNCSGTASPQTLALTAAKTCSATFNLVGATIAPNKGKATIGPNKGHIKTSP